MARVTDTAASACMIAELKSVFEFLVEMIRGSACPASSSSLLPTRLSRLNMLRCLRLLMCYRVPLTLKKRVLSRRQLGVGLLVNIDKSLTRLVAFRISRGLRVPTFHVIGTGNVEVGGMIKKEVTLATDCEQLLCAICKLDSPINIRNLESSKIHMLSFGAEDASAIAMACALDFAFPEIVERLFVGVVGIKQACFRQDETTDMRPLVRRDRAGPQTSPLRLSLLCFCLHLPTFAYICRHCRLSNHLGWDKYAHRPVERSLCYISQSLVGVCFPISPIVSESCQSICSLLRILAGN
jgi:hypothetical protein